MEDSLKKTNRQLVLRKQETLKDLDKTREELDNKEEELLRSVISHGSL